MILVTAGALALCCCATAPPSPVVVATPPPAIRAAQAGPAQGQLSAGLPAFDPNKLPQGQLQREYADYVSSLMTKGGMSYEQATQAANESLAARMRLMPQYTVDQYGIVTKFEPGMPPTQVGRMPGNYAPLPNTTQ
jgi:hypothetical protein